MQILMKHFIREILFITDINGVDYSGLHMPRKPVEFPKFLRFFESIRQILSMLQFSSDSLETGRTTVFWIKTGLDKRITVYDRSTPF